MKKLNMKKLNKELLVEMINEFISMGDTGYNGAPVISNEPVADVRNYDPDNKLVDFDEQSERIIGLLNDLTKSIRGGMKSGAVSPSDGEKIRDFPLQRIRRALDYVSSTIDAQIGDDNLDMTTPEV
tara:strand:- start:3510 stop:3887 length:378 start_codon:yes stop_codon:yes gene_type:complete